MSAEPPPRVILVAGPSGSGKSRLARLSGIPVLRLDDFYFDADHPGMPHVRGTIDWDDPRTWDADAAVTALRTLLDTGRATVPVYSISESRATGTHEITLGSAHRVIAEGIFAIPMRHACSLAGLDVDAVWLDRPSVVNFSRRLRRDFKQHRKPPLVLIRRGLALWRGERALRRTALDAGFLPLGMDEAIRHLAAAS